MCQIFLNSQLFLDRHLFLYSQLFLTRQVIGRRVRSVALEFRGLGVRVDVTYIYWCLLFVLIRQGLLFIAMHTLCLCVKYICMCQIYLQTPEGAFAGDGSRGLGSSKSALADMGMCCVCVCLFMCLCVCLCVCVCVCARARMCVGTPATMSN